MHARRPTLPAAARDPECLQGGLNPLGLFHELAKPVESRVAQSKGALLEAVAQARVVSVVAGDEGSESELPLRLLASVAGSACGKVAWVRQLADAGTSAASAPSLCRLHVRHPIHGPRLVFYPRLWTQLMSADPLTPNPRPQTPDAAPQAPSPFTLHPSP